MDNFVATLTPFVGEVVARLIIAIIILLVGWLVASLVAGAVKAILHRLQVDNRLAKSTDSKQGSGLPIESWVGTGVFWLILLAFIISALQVLNLTTITQPLNDLLNMFLLYLPRLLAAAVLALIAHVVGSIARKLVAALASRTKLEERITTNAGSKVSISSPLGDAAYYLVWLFFLPGILGALGLESLLLPVQNMINDVLAYLPNLVAAGILLVVGWFVARIVQRIVEGFLASAGVDRLAERLGFAKYMGGLTVSRLLGLIVFIVILVPVVTAALDALQLRSLTAPLTLMINQALSVIPSIVAAIILLVLTYVVARWFIGILVEILSGVGFNSLPRILGLSTEGSIGGRTLAQWAGDVALIIIMLLAAVQAAQIVGWTAVTVAVGAFGVQIVQIVFGLIVIGIGVYLANLAARFVDGMTFPNKRLVALVARVSIIAFAGAMGLTAMGFAEQIVFIAFALILGAVAIAIALAFGLGGREAAAKQLAEWSDSLDKPVQ